MSGRGGFKWVMLVTTAAAAAVLFLVVAACTIQLRGDSDAPPTGSSASRATNPLGAELERCRKVTSDQTAELQDCRAIWAENRRRFLGSKKTPGVTSADAQPGSPTPSLAQPKHPDRLPQGWPPVATPERE
jgi:conjugative transfer region protein TrbK